MPPLKLLALFAGFAAASPVLVDTLADVPSGHEVQITGTSYSGTGCPAGNVSAELSSDLTTLTLLYDQLKAEAGNSVSTFSYRRNCDLTVRLKYPQGWQFSVFKADYRGYAQIPAGDRGTSKANYFFSGDPRRANLRCSQIFSAVTIRGPYDGDYLKTDQFGGVQSTGWSPCGVEGLLNIHSEVRLSPMDTVKPALLTVTSLGTAVQWRRCR
ncbi:hypothetical protein VTI74DRAFT_8162 [Chaetomium olivicolor]